jgi:glycosyltransferase involved in cell wall biosynthesis
VEAQACGKPVIAYGKGGALDSVIEGVTGVFFSEQTVDSFIQGIHDFETRTFDAREIRLHAEKYSNEEFIGKMKKFIFQIRLKIS